jgi:dipeptidyl aminopeptidase/acylaminoacyl peptidase
MRTSWRGVAALALAVACIASAHPAAMSRAAAPATPALAYVSPNGQVVVQENGTLTQVGPGQDPVWSPNGANLLYQVANFAGNTADLYVADTHGANSRRVITNAYPFVSPSWSPDSQYVVYTAPAAGANPGASSFSLEVRALRLANGKVQVLGHIPCAGGCSLKVTALQDAQARAQGSYHGVPSTLIWAQGGLVAVQRSCTGLGLTVFTAGKARLTQLPTWSAGVLAPDGKTVAAVVTPSAHSLSQVGLLSAPGGKVQVLGPKIGASVLTWSPDGKTIYGAVEPADPRAGFAHVYHLSRDGKAVGSLGMIQAAGIYHLSPDPSGKSLVLAVVASAPANAAAPPSVLVYAVSTLTSGQAQAIIAAVQPSWRP